MAQARLAAALDLCSRLQHIHNGMEVHFVAARAEDEEALRGEGATPFVPQTRPFHFGMVVAEFADRIPSGPFGYFGGASAPLATTDVLEEAFRFVAGPGPQLVANNLHSTDWFLVNDKRAVLPALPGLNTDNPLAWRVKGQGGVDVRAMPPSAATRADLDTPADALMMRGHPSLGPHLTQVIEQAPPERLERVATIRAILRENARTIAVIGRSSSHVWSELERLGHLWTRLYVEERGMVANGRAERGDVRSLIGYVLEALGEEWLVDRLAEMADAALWDVRVSLAHGRSWPSDADRFASDMGWADQVSDPGLQRLTRAVTQTSIPIVCGGHGVVAGSALALLESL